MSDIRKYITLLENAEKLNFDSVIYNIKLYLIGGQDELEFYNSFDDAWVHFVNNQEVGDCQSIGIITKLNIPNLTTHFGEITLDEPMVEVVDYDEDGEEIEEEIYTMTHHWVEYHGKILEFFKGTLKDYIHFSDLYSVHPHDENAYRSYRKRF